MTKELREFTSLFVEKTRRLKPSAADTDWFSRSWKIVPGQTFDLHKLHKIIYDNMFRQPPYKADAPFKIAGDYLDLYLDRLGEGTSRETYLVNSKKVLKLAMNQAGLAQNKTEYFIYKDSKTKYVMAAILAHDPSFHWVISELVRPLGANQSGTVEFEKLSGVRWGAAVSMFKTGKISKLDRIKYASTPAFAFLKACKQLVEVHRLLPGDLELIDHWGKTNDGRVVLYDYGYDVDVANAFYHEEGGLRTL